MIKALVANGLSLCLASIVVGFVGGFIINDFARLETGVYTPSSNIFIECISASRTESTNVTAATALEYERIGDLCYRSAFSNLQLEDFTIRRDKFIQQMYADRLILYMVVLITLSGVALAGLQIFASFRLAKGREELFFAQDHKLEIATDRVVLSTSVVGLLILAISFAFFYVFVTHIYKIDELTVQRDPGTRSIAEVGSSQTIPDGPMLTGGELGSPPSPTPRTDSSPQEPPSPNQN